MVTDLDEGLAERVLVSLDAEIRRRERLLRAVCADDLTVYRRNATDALARLVVVVDELATLANELPDFLTALVGIAQDAVEASVSICCSRRNAPPGWSPTTSGPTPISGSLSESTIAATRWTWSATNDRRRSRGVPGRAALRLGPDELVVFQTAPCTGPVVRPPPGS